MAYEKQFWDRFSNDDEIEKIEVENINLRKRLKEADERKKKTMHELQLDWGNSKCGRSIEQFIYDYFTK